MAEYQDAFISYGRADSKSFAAKLYERLNQEGLKVWFDFADIPLGVDYQKQIDDGIETAHNFLFIISPHSVHSPYCGLEVDLALRCNKRIIPLLHVEQISRDTWQQRNPGGTEEDWVNFMAAGKHSSFKGMHPAISKINWIYFREGIEDFETSFQGLLSVIARQADYVYQHTVYLQSALQWDRHQQQPEYLLVGESLEEALTWLKIQFNREQPPCLPTDLHCRFIAQSNLINCNNHSDIYLCYADEDQEVASALYWDLLHESFLVWNRKMDLEAGGAFEENILSAIESANIVIYLASNHASRSKGCQKELSHALNLSKRIIVLQVSSLSTDRRESSKAGFKNTIETRGSRSALNRIYNRIEAKSSDSSTHPLDNLVPIKWVDADTKTVDPNARKQLFQELQQDALFHHQQTDFLLRALEWKTHRYNAQLLLRGYILTQGQAWLHLAQDVHQRFYTPLQQDYIQVSGNTPPPDTLEVFWLYAPIDRGFTHRLNQALKVQGRVTWFAQEQLDPDDPDYVNQCQQKMLEATNCVAIVSPSFLQDSTVQRLLTIAVSLRKRLLTVLYRPIDPSLLNTLKSQTCVDFHPVLALFEQFEALGWIDFARHHRDFYIGVSDLIRGLDLDRDYVQAHSKWALRAHQWSQENQAEDLLLQGNDLEMAYLWLHQATLERRSPPVTDLQKQFIEASQAALEQRLYLKELQRQKELHQARRIALISTGAGVLMAAMALFTAAQLRQTEIETIETRRISAELLFSQGNELDGLVQIVSATQRLRHSPFNLLWPYSDTAVQGTLREVFLNIAQQNEISAQAVKLSSSGRLLAVHQADGTLRLWDIDGKPRAEWKTDRQEVGVLDISPDDRYLATAGQSGEVSLWSIPTPDSQSAAPTKDPLQKTALKCPSAVLNTPATSSSPAPSEATPPNDAPNRNLLNCWLAHNGTVNALSFSPDGTSLLSAGNGKAYRWDLRGTPRAVMAMAGQVINKAAFSPDGTRILTISENYRAELWTPKGYSLGTLNTTTGVETFAFGLEGQYLLLGLRDGHLELWNPNTGERLQRRKVSSTGISAIAFSPQFFTPNSQNSVNPILVTGSDDGVIRLWDDQSRLQKEIFAHTGSIQFLQFQETPQGELSGLVSLGEQDGVLAFWSLDGWQKFKRAISNTRIKTLEMNADGSFFTLVNQGGQARMWSLRGHQRYTLTSAGPQVKTVRYSPDGRFLATLTNNNILELWHLDFPRSPHKIHQWSRVQDVQFSQDAQRLVWLEQDAQRGQVIQVRSLNPLRLDQGHTFTTPESSRNTLSTLQLSPDSHHIAIQSDTGRVYIWNLLEGQFLDLRPHAKPLKKITLHPFLNTFVTTDTEGEIRYWQGEKNLWRHKLEAKQDSAEVYLTQFSPDGKSLITAQWGGILQIWDAQTGNPDPINTHLKQTPIKGKILSVAFNPSFDSSTNPLSLILLVERPDSSLFFQSWTNQWQQTPPIDFNVHQEGIREATFIPGTPWLQTISWGGIGRLWNTQGQSLAKIQNHYGRIHSMTVSPDHRWLVTAGRDGTAKFWSLDSTSALMEQSCQWLSLRLTSTSSLDPQEKICPNTPTAPRQKNP